MTYYLFTITRTAAGVMRDLNTVRYDDLESARKNFYSKLALGWNDADFQLWSVVLMDEEGSVIEKGLYRSRTPEPEV